METHIIPDPAPPALPVYAPVQPPSLKPIQPTHHMKPAIAESIPTPRDTTTKVTREMLIHQHSHSFFLVATTIASLLIGLVVGFAFGSKVSPVPTLVRSNPETTQELPAETHSNTFCTMDTKLCADGSSVGRSGPTCEFLPCPEELSAISPASSSATIDGEILTKTSGTCVNSALNLKATLPANSSTWKCESHQTELLISSASGVNLMFSSHPIDNPCGPGSVCTLEPFFQGSGIVINGYREEELLKQVYGAFADGTWAMITWPDMDTKPLTAMDKSQLVSILTSIKKGASSSASPQPVR